MQTENPPEGELRFIPVREGRYRLIIMDRHKSIHEEVADTLEALNAWLEEQDGDIAFPLGPDDMEHLADLLDAHGAVHIRSSMDADLVFVKGGLSRA